MFPYLQQVRGHIFHHSIPTSKWRFSFCGFCCCFCCCFFKIKFKCYISYSEPHWISVIRSAWIGKFDIFHSPRLLLSKKRDETYTQRDQEGAQNSNSVAPPGFSRKFVFCFRQILFIRKYVTFWRNNHNINMKIYALRETKNICFQIACLKRKWVCNVNKLSLAIKHWLMMSDIEKDKKGKNIPKSNIFRQRFQSTD